MKTKYLVLILTLSMVAFGAGEVSAHCEIPCGIYDDQLRADLIAEHATTIEKSMKKIVELGKQNPLNYNQLVRWVSNKEKHATEVQHIVTQYFMTQRIKPDAEKYSEKLTVLHRMLIAAMQCKQTTDLSNVNTLRSLLKEFEILYFGHTTK
ncbi:MAG: superoxide dismutase [Ni] [Syntrophobacterales bacterium]|jgi:nickel superoxide dismutase